MAEPTDQTFHPFPRLPLELRQQIWELSIGPREVVVGYTESLKHHGRQDTPPPPLLLACAESRSHIQQFYTKAFIKKEKPPKAKSFWIKFDMDELFILDWELRDFSSAPLIRRLTLVTHDIEGFYYGFVVPTKWKSMPALETLTVVDKEGNEEFGWVLGWGEFMRELYSRCDPVPFYVKIAYQDHVLTRDNWLKTDRQMRRKYWGPDMEANPQDYNSGDEISDDDDDPRDSRYRPWKQHTRDCDCPHIL